MSLSADQIMGIGIVASVVVQVVKLLMQRFKKPIGRKWITVSLFVVSVFLAFLWARPALPVWPATVDDPGAYATAIMVYIGQLITVASAIIGFAVAIYNLLFEKVFNALGMGKTTTTQEAQIDEKAVTG